MEKTQAIVDRNQDFGEGNDQLENYKLILETLPTAMYICDTQGKMTYCNKAAEDLWGRLPEIGTDAWCGSWKIFDAYGNILPQEHHPAALAINEKREIEGVEVIIERPDGTRRNVMPHSKPLFDGNGDITGVVSALTDITDKKHIQDLLDANADKYKTLSESLEKKVEERTATLRKSEERYHKMVEEVQDYAILLLSRDGYILNWNKGAEKIKGYTEGEIVGKNFRIFYMEKDRLEKLPEKLIQQAYDTGRAHHEGWRVRKDGSKFWGSIVITALHDENKDIIGFSKVTRDLTERKLAEDQMNHYLRDIEFRNKQLEEYAYIASHDLQEPLRKIQIFSELLEGNLGNADAVRKNLDKINSSAKRMSNLIKDVLKYSQLSRADELYLETDLNSILNNVLEDYILLIEQKKVIIKRDYLPIIMGIPIQLNQLFSNLISNALKFSSEHPEITIHSELLTGAEANHTDLISNRQYLKLIFKDNGIGFEQQYGEQIFKMFKRLSDSSGTGIGLALCKKIVENHNGIIQVESAPDVGTAFTLFIPVS